MSAIRASQFGRQVFRILPGPPPILSKPFLAGFVLRLVGMVHTKCLYTIRYQVPNKSIAQLAHNMLTDRWEFIIICSLYTLCSSTYMQGKSRLVDITAGGDFLGFCDQKSSYKHVSDFGRLRSYGNFLISVHALM
jgi:hypothetical protein